MRLRQLAVLIVIIMVVAILLGVLYTLPGTAWADDADSPPTVMRSCYGALPDESTGCASGGGDQHTVPATAPVPGNAAERSTFILYYSADVSHIYWSSGPQACVFTLREDSHRHYHDVGGGRDCGPTQHLCGYYGAGYRVHALSGGSCEAFGIPTCGGPLCY